MNNACYNRRMLLAVRIGVFVVAFVVGSAFTTLIDFLDPAIPERSVVDVVTPAVSQPAHVASPEISADDILPTPHGAYIPTLKNKDEEDTALWMDVDGDYRGGFIKIGEAFLSSEKTIVNRQTVEMRTATTKGVYFVFKGTFLKDGFETFFDDGDVVLRGQLSKYRGGRRIYTFSSSYQFFPEICAWREENR